MTKELITPDGFSLVADFVPSGSHRAIVFAHGMTVDRNDEGIFVRGGEELQQKGFATISFDFRAHGESSGHSETDFTISGEATDLATVVTFLKEQGYTWIGLAGASFGGGVSALYAGTHTNEISKLFLVNPVLDYDRSFLHPTTPWTIQYFHDAAEKIKQNEIIRVGSRRFAIGPRLLEEMSQYFPYQALSNYQHPLLIVHGTADTKVSYQDTKDIFDHLSNTEKTFVSIEGSEHGFHEEPFETDVVKLLVEFFTS